MNSGCIAFFRPAYAFEGDRASDLYREMEKRDGEGTSTRAFGTAQDDKIFLGGFG